MILSLGGRFWASQQASVHIGPTHIAADATQVIVIAARNFYHLSAEGELLAQHPLDVLGLDDIPIDLRLMQDGSLLVASQRPAQVRFCDTSSWQCEQAGSAIQPRPERQFKLLAEEESSKLFLTDARGDSLWSWDLKASEAQQLLPEHSLAGPNDLAFDSQGNLWVADTDNRRIVELLKTAAGDWEIGRVHSAINEFTGGKRYFPMMLASAADGHLWVTQASEFSAGLADLQIYHPHKGAIAQVPLPGSILATDVVSLANDILVSDMESGWVYRVDSKTRTAVIFGDEQFQLAMSAIHTRQQRYELMSHIAMAGVIIFAVLMLVAAVVATPKSKRWTQAPGLIDLTASDKTMPRVKGIYWLKRKEGLDRMLKWLPLAGFILVGVILAGLVVIYLVTLNVSGSDATDQVQTKVSSLGLVLPIAGLFSGVLIAIIHMSVKNLKNRIGTDGKQLHIRLDDGRQLSVAPSDLAYTRRVILFRQYTLPFQSGKNQGVYQADEVETWIAPLLGEASKLSEWQALKYQWKHGDFLLAWSIIVGIAGGLALIMLAV
jgi:hypothetical protein